MDMNVAITLSFDSLFFLVANTPYSISSQRYTTYSITHLHVNIVTYIPTTRP